MNKDTLARCIQQGCTDIHRLSDREIVAALDRQNSDAVEFVLFSMALANLTLGKPWDEGMSKGQRARLGELLE